MKKQALGRGLGALIEDANLDNRASNISMIDEIPLNEIEVNPFQPRKEFDKEGLSELANSIREIGIIQPITVRKMDDGRFQLITGERRLKACEITGLSKIPAYIRTADDQGMLEMALVENIQREDLNAIEIAISYNRLIEECNLTQENLSERIGKKRASISNYLRLLKLPAEIQLGIREKKIMFGHARGLITVEEPVKQLKIYHEIIRDELSVRQVEEKVRTLSETVNPEGLVPSDSEKVKTLSQFSEEYQQLQTHLANYFDTRVEFKRTAKGIGKIIISFKSDDDLERILGIFDTLKKD